MKLKNIALKNGKPINLGITFPDEKKLVLPNEVFEIDDAKAKALLEINIEGKPVVELVKAPKPTTKEE